MAAGRFESSLSEYPPADYRRLIEAAAARYGVARTRSSSVPARTRSSTSSARRSSAGGSGGRACPDVRHVPRDHRATRRGGGARPAARRRRGLRARPAGGARRRPRAAPWSGSAPRTTRPRMPEPDGRDRDAAPADRRRRGRGRATGARSSSSTRRTPSSPATTRCSDLRFDHPNLDRRPHREQGLCAGRAPRRVRGRAPRARRPDEPVPPARARCRPCRSTSRPRRCRTRTSRRPTSHESPRSGPGCTRRCAARAGRSGRRSRISCWSTWARSSGRRRSPRRCSARGLVPRTFPCRPPARRPPPADGPQPRAGRPPHRGGRRAARPSGTAPRGRDATLSRRRRQGRLR